MKVAKDKVLPLLHLIKSTIEEEILETPKQELSVFFLDDITLSFTREEKPIFYGLTFEALGRDFSVINNLEVLVAAENDEGDEEGYLVEDEALVELLNEFLGWRTKVLEKFGA